MRGLRYYLLLMFGVFVVTPLVYAQKFSVLYNFGSGGEDPLQPTSSGIISQGRDGNLYSSSPNSMTGDGAAFMITTSGELTVVYTFTPVASGIFPYSGLVLGTDSNFYGTTEYDGSGYGTIFKLAPDGTFSVLYSFTDAGDGGNPYAPPIQASDGNFYGTTAGNSYDHTYGTVYKLTPEGQLTTLYQFDLAHGTSPDTPLVEGDDRNLYGVTTAGGNLNLGVVFRISRKGNLHVLYNFDGARGSRPFGPLVLGNDGNFYGTTFNGGRNGSGVVFKITPKGRLTVIHDFAGTGGGFYPVTGLVQASDGNFYGTTHNGGLADVGTIFRVNPLGEYAVLHAFNGTDGKFPMVTLTQHTNGILYGDTKDGGTVSSCSENCGTFYGLDVGLPPFVSLAPTWGKVGQKVEFLGQGFTGTTVVSFNGAPANFKVRSDTYLTATVPGGATTGFVSAATPTGNLKSNRKFRVTK